jgi:hypothetical protein
MDFKKTVILVVFVFCLILGIYYVNAAVSYSNLSYIVGQCSPQAGATSYYENQILNFTWDDNFGSNFDTYVTHNCNADILGAKYKVLSDNVYIKYALKECDTCLPCYCTSKVSYKLESIQKDSAYVFHHERYKPDFFEKLAFQLYNALKFGK